MARYFSKSSRNGNSKRIISGPPFPLPKWRNIVGDESGGVERYKGGVPCVGVFNDTGATFRTRFNIAYRFMR